MLCCWHRIIYSWKVSLSLTGKASSRMTYMIKNTFNWCLRVHCSAKNIKKVLRTYKGQFSFFKKFYCVRIRDKFLKKDNFQSKNLVNFLLSQGTQILNNTKNCEKCQLGEVPVGEFVSWGTGLKNLTLGRTIFNGLRLKNINKIFDILVRC